MIIIEQYLFDRDIPSYSLYEVKIKIEDLPCTYFIKKVDAETNGQWDETKAQAYLDARYDELLASARTKNIQLIDKKLEVTKEVEAVDFIVASPVVSKDLKKVRSDIKSERTKSKKSIAYLSLALADIVEDLIKRVEILENKIIKL